MAIQILVNGTKFTGWLEASITTSMDSIAGSFTLSIAVNRATELLFFLRQPVTLFVDNRQVIDGFIERLSGTYSALDDRIIFSGRDRTADVIDNNIGDKADIKGTISFVSVIEKILQQNNLSRIKVINNVPDIEDFTKKDIISPEVGQNLFEHLNQYAAKRQVFLITDGFANIVINRDTLDKITTPLIHRVAERAANLGNNIIRADWSYDDTRRYNLYKMVSQGNMSLETDQTDISDIDIKSFVTRKGTAIDAEVRESRIFVAQAEKSMTDAECEKRSQWQRAIARARSFNYSVTIDGHSHADDIWRPNRLVKVTDERTGIDGTFLINEVNYRTDNDRGNTCVIGIVDLNRYSLEAQEGGFKTTKAKFVLDADQIGELNKLGEPTKGINE